MAWRCTSASDRDDCKHDWSWAWQAQHLVTAAAHAPSVELVHVSAVQSGWYLHAGCKLPKQGLQWSVVEPSVDAESSLVLHWLIACMCQHNPALRPTALALVQQVLPQHTCWPSVECGVDGPDI